MNVDTINLAARVALDDALGQNRGEGVFDFAEDADVLAHDLHPAGARDSGFCGEPGVLARRDGRNARRSIGRNCSLWGERIAAAHEVAAFAPDTLDVDILLGLGLD